LLDICGHFLLEGLFDFILRQKLDLALFYAWHLGPFDPFLFSMAIKYTTREGCIVAQILLTLRIL
jgi:hypothetical protein